MNASLTFDDGSVALLILEALKHAEGKDKTRSNLCGVTVCLKGQHIQVFEATDGHRACRITVTHKGVTSTGGHPTTYHRITLPTKDALVLAKLSKGKRFDLELVEREEGSWPKLDRATPERFDAPKEDAKRECAGVWGVNAAYLVDALEACAKVAGKSPKHDPYAVKIQTGVDAYSPCLVYASDLGVTMTIECAVMPMRL